MKTNAKTQTGSKKLVPISEAAISKAGLTQLRFKNKKIHFIPNKPKKVQPPFPALQSFNVASIILSYVLYEKDAPMFLSRLSHNAGNYYKAHKDILNGILPNIPPLEKQVCFGEMSKSNVQEQLEKHDKYFEYPTNEQWEAMKHGAKIKTVDSITFMRSSDDAYFRGISIGYKNQATKTFYGNCYSLKRHELKVEKLASEKIAKMSLRMDSGSGFDAVRLYRHDGSLIYQSDSGYSNSGKNRKWNDYEFGLDEYLVGFYGAVDRDVYLKRLGVITVKYRMFIDV